MPARQGAARWLAAAALFLLVLISLISTAASVFVGCATHELGHAAVGTALGYEVEAIEICPGSASVSWAASSLAPIDTTVEAWAGGIVAAGVLAGAYIVVIGMARRASNGRVWWALGLPLPAVAAVELLLGIMEGYTQGRYGELIAGSQVIWIPVIGLAAVVGAGVHLALWRSHRRRRRWNRKPR
jgi:hypothetical protein